MIRTVLTSMLLAVGAVAQTISEVPNVTSFQNVDRPLAGGIGRYQQWFSANSLQQDIPEPMRFQQAEILAGSSLTANATTIDCEVLIGHGNASGITGTFDNNYATPPVVVATRQNRNLLAGASGAVVMTIPFTTLFTWDRVRPIVMEIRIYGNGFLNQPFLYNNRGSTVATGQTSRVYQAGSAGAPSGQVQQGIGLIVRFTARPGAVVDFGSGCMGGGGVVPRNIVLQVPSPAILWQHQIVGTASQQYTMWVIGNDTTLWETTPLPTDFAVLLGNPPSGCFLRTNVLAFQILQTVGGGPGLGAAQFDWQLPPVSSYVGFTFYTQWLGLDPASPNGFMNATQGVQSIVAPVGG